MKLLKRQISSKDGAGSVLLRPETPEDLWHAYNLLQKGDMVRCTTLRKVTKESSTGSTTSNKIRMNLTIEINKVEFDATDGEIRLTGPNRQESDFVRLGASHTLSLELHRNFNLEKLCWDRIYLDRIDDACHPERGAEVAAVVMNTGLAHVCLVTDYMTVVKAKVDLTIPRKRTGSSNHAKAVTRFHEAVYQALLRTVDLDQVKCLLLASPGYVKDDFYKYLTTQAVRRDDRPFIEHKGKFLLCRASSGHKHALEEVFADPSILSQLNDTKMAKEVSELNRFMRMMDTHPDKAYYGYTHVCKANEELAIESLLVTDALFQSSDVKTRKKYVALVESVRENGGKVFTFSTLHVSGTQLDQVSGVAAILRFPLPDLDALEEAAAEFEENNNTKEGEDDAPTGEEEDMYHKKEDMDVSRHLF